MKQLQNLGEKLSPEEIEGLLDDADKDGEGFINYAEFCSIKNLVWFDLYRHIDRGRAYLR